MNRNFYFFGNFFLGLGVASGLLQSILYFLVGAPMFFLDSFMGWFLMTCIIFLAGSFFVLKYYHYRKYHLTFYSGTIFAILNVFLILIFFTILITREFENAFRMPVVVFAMLVAIVYGVSLMIYPVGKSPWLKTAGILILLVTVVDASGFLWSMMDLNFRTDGRLEKIGQWTSLIRSIIPLFFMIQFSHEAKALKVEHAITVPQRSSEFFGFAGILIFLVTIVFGVLIAKDSFSSVHWKNVNVEHAKELARKSETRKFVSISGDSQCYLLLKPLDYDPQKKYPLVVCLPYGGYESPPAELLSNDFYRKKYPSFLLIPYSAAGSSWGGIPGRPSRDALVYAIINSLDDPGIDVRRRYVSGVSLGGYGSWQFICMHPEMFAAAIPVCGAGDTTLAAKIVDVPVWAFHGAKDKNVPVSGSRDMISAIRKAGGNPKYTEFPDEAHNVWHQVSETPGLIDWLFAQQRE